MEVNAGNAAPAGTAVCAQLSVDVAIAASGVQLKLMSGALAPKAAGALIMRLAPFVIANEAEPAGIIHAKETLAFATPAVATVTAAIPVPPVNVTAAGSGLRVGATPTATVAAGQVKPQTRDTGAPAPAVSVHVKVAVPAVAARVQPKSILPAELT